MTPPGVVSVGVFDGFHRGHAEVIARAAGRARDSRARLVVFTFDPHPYAVLQDVSPRPWLTLPAERASLLREAGADEVRFLRFTRRLADKDAEAFLADHVFPFHRLTALVVGYDFAMGRDRTGTLPALRTLGARRGFETLAVPAAEVGGEVVSSSAIRGALERGEVARAARALGREYALAGTVVPGEGRGAGIGFPTANLDVPALKLRPARGVYAVRVRGAGGSPRQGVLNLGCRPTFGGERETVEVHLFDFTGDLRETRLEVAFVERLRSEVKFKDSKELGAQIARDAARARAVLDRDPGPH